MMSLNARIDGFRFQFPKEFLTDNIKEKYALQLQRQKGFYQDPLEFLNETIKNVNILGFNNAVVVQSQQYKQEPPSGQLHAQRLINRHTLQEVSHRSLMNPVSLVSNVLEVQFRHTLGFINYFMILENFFEKYKRENNEEDTQFNIYLIDENGVTRSRVILYNPVVDAMDNLGLDYTQPISQNKEFKVSFKFSNFDYEFYSEEQNIDEE